MSDRGAEMLESPIPKDFKLTNAWELPEQILNLTPDQNKKLGDDLAAGRSPAKLPGDTYREFSWQSRPGHSRWLVEEKPRFKGGFYQVHLGFDRHLGRPVAVKLKSIPSDPNALSTAVPDRDTTATLEREAKTIARIKHPGVVEVYDYVEYEPPEPRFADQRFLAIIEEWLNQQISPSLDRVLRQRRLKPEAIVKIMASLAETVDFLAEKNIFHQDLKPSHVFLLPDGKTKISDLGIASSVLYDYGGANVHGTPAYMPPEKVSKAKQNCGLPGEVFSLASIALEMITNLHLFNDHWSKEAILQAKMADDFDFRLINKKIVLNPTLEAVFIKALNKDPDQRYQTAAEFASALKTSFLSPER